MADAGPSWLDGAPVTATLCDWRKHERGHVVYTLTVCRPYGRTPRSWPVERRYTDFRRLQAAVFADCSVAAPLPPKRLVGNTRAEFVAERAKGLQEFVGRLLGHPALGASAHVRAFLDPRYDANTLQDAALCNASMVLRGTAGWHITKSLPAIGRRLDKQFALVQAAGGRRRDLLTWYAATDTDGSSSSSCEDALQSLCRLEHPYIRPPAFAAAGTAGTGCLVVYPFCEDGSLRDQMYRTRPTDPYLRKYYNAESDTIYPLDMPDLRYVGRHLLEAMSFLHKIGIPYGNLHAGNVYVSENGCLLGDVEAGVLGRRSQYWHFAAQLKCIASLESLDVYCFGHTLLELATGDALLAPYIPDDSDMPPCAAKIRSLLVTLLSESAVRGEHYPSVGQLLGMELFAGVPALRPAAHQVAVSRRVSEQFGRAAGRMLDELMAHRRQLREVDRGQRLAALLSSDAHRIERRRILKQWSLSMARTGDSSSPPAADDAATTATAPKADGMLERIGEAEDSVRSSSSAGSQHRLSDSYSSGRPASTAANYD